jgi:hypothetical protein
MLTLPRLKQLRSALEASQSKIVAPTAWGSIPVSEQGSNVIIPIVIASMAGGSGASMFLDVCRVLGQFPGINPANIGCFLYTADVFAQLAEDRRANVEGNAMGSVSEIVAAISRLSEPADRQLFESLGVQVPGGSVPAFGRVLPIGSRVGGTGAYFGDGSAVSVYRGIARALAGVMVSEAATQQYLDYFLGNPTPLHSSSERFGWRVSDIDLPFGTMGFASLSLGRDRYMHYAAQRLSRATVDHLVAGHENPTSTLPSTDQLRQLMDNQIVLSLQAMGFPTPGMPIPAWFQNVAYPRPQWEAAAREAGSQVWTALNGLGAGQAGTWLNAARAELNNARPITIANLQRSAYSWAEGWATSLEAAAKAEFLRATSAFGLPYGRDLMLRLRQMCDGMVSDMATAGMSADGADPMALDPAIGQQAEALGKQQVAGDHLLGQRLRAGVQGAMENRLRREAARLGAEVLRSFATDVLSGLARAGDDALRLLTSERARTSSGAGLAQLHSFAYPDWPGESDQVPVRFDHAENEVLLTTSEGFPAQFRAHVASGVGTYTEGLAAIRHEVCTGVWETTGARPDFQVVTQAGHWRAPVLNRSAADGLPTPQAVPAYRLEFSSADVMQRAQARLGAPGSVFLSYAGQSISGYLNDTAASPLDRSNRQAEFAAKFTETLALARPVVGIDEAMVQRLHGRGVLYLYSFSEMPFDDADPVAVRLTGWLDANSELDPTTRANFDEALRKSKPTVGKIAVFGSYQKVSTVCYRSLLEPIKSRWASAPVSYQRSLWLWKRTRPLYASLAMSHDEAVRLVAGWYLGRLVGLVRQERRDAPQICTSRGWISFGPLLESEEASIQQTADILPAVLMSHAWALARCEGDPDLTALAPFEALRRLVDTTGSTQQAPPLRDLAGTRLLAAAFRGDSLVLDGERLPSDPLPDLLANAGTQQAMGGPVPASGAAPGYAAYPGDQAAAPYGGGPGQPGSPPGLAPAGGNVGTPQFPYPQSQQAFGPAGQPAYGNQPYHQPDYAQQSGLAPAYGQPQGPVGPADQVAARFETTSRWLRQLHDLAVGSGAIRENEGQVSSYVARADALPGANLFAEIGPLVVEAVAMLTQMAQAAKDLDARPPSSGPEPGSGVYL